MSQKLWVQHQTADRIFIDKISIDGCDDIADFLKEIKKESQLAIPQNTAIALYKPDGETEIDVGDFPSDLVAGNSRTNAIVVKINESSGPKHNSMADKLKYLGVQFTIRDINYILSSDRAGLGVLMLPNLTKDIAQAILNNPKSKIKSETRKAIYW